MIKRTAQLLPALVLALASMSAARAGELAIIIDDLGYAVGQAHAIAALPGPIAVAVLPDAPQAAAVARIAHAGGKDVLLHFPLQAVDQPATAAMVTLDTSEQALAGLLDQALTRVPHVVGVNSHMGSLVTRHPGHMAWLMQAVKRYPGMYFIDSYTTEHSVALRAAREAGLPALRRHVFLDHEITPAAISHEFGRAIARARRDGFAVAIGHPYPETLLVLERELGALAGTDIQLVRLGDLVARHARIDE